MAKVENISAHRRDCSWNETSSLEIDPNQGILVFFSLLLDECAKHHQQSAQRTRHDRFILRQEGIEVGFASVSSDSRAAGTSVDLI